MVQLYNHGWVVGFSNQAMPCWALIAPDVLINAPTNPAAHTSEPPITTSAVQSNRFELLSAAANNKHIQTRRCCAAAPLVDARHTAIAGRMQQVAGGKAQRCALAQPPRGGSGSGSAFSLSAIGGRQGQQGMRPPMSSPWHQNHQRWVRVEAWQVTPPPLPWATNEVSAVAANRAGLGCATSL